MSKRLHYGRYDSRKKAEGYVQAMHPPPGQHAEITEATVYDVWIVIEEEKRGSNDV